MASKKSKRNQRTLITVAVSPETLGEAKNLAAADHRTVSAWVRLAIAEKLSRDGKAAA